MAVFRVNKTDNYTVMSNAHLRDKELSLKAKGLLSQMLSLPPDWDYTVGGLIAINSEKRAAIESALKELQDAGYLVVTKKYPNETASGRIEYIYDIYEEKQGVEKQGVENQGLVFQGVENPQQLNKEESNTDKSNIKLLNTDNKGRKPKKNDSLIDDFTENEELRESLNDFVQMRKLIKKPLTEKGLTLMLNKLKSLSKDERIQIAIVNQSIEHNWQSVYPLKELPREESILDGIL